MLIDINIIPIYFLVTIRIKWCFIMKKTKSNKPVSKRDKKRQTISAIIVIVLVLAMVVPLVLGALVF